MLSRTSLLFISFFLYAISMYSQVTAPDCTTAINVCSNPNFSISPMGAGNIEITTSYTVSNPINNPAGIIPTGGYGCLKGGELNSTWLVINIQTSGTLEFSMGAGTGPGAQAGCYDWIMYAVLPNTCNDIQNNIQPPVRCCWNSFCSGGTGLSSPANLPPGGYQEDYGIPLNVNCGDKYIICFSNYSSVSTLVPINFFGTAIVSCTSVNCSTSIEDYTTQINNKTDNVFIFPNPSSDQLIISYHKEEVLYLYNDIGQQIRSIELDRSNNFKAEISGLDNGIYFLTGKTFREKVIVLK